MLCAFAAIGAQNRSPQLLGDVATGIPQLRRSIAINFTGVTIETALREIGRRSELPITYNDRILPKTKTVWLTREDIRTDEALQEVLRGSGLRLLALSTGQVVVVRDPEPAVGTISGTVTEAKSGQAVAQAQIGVLGTTLARTTDANGRYSITGVVAGLRTVTVKRLGYDPISREVTVTDGATATADFELVVAATRLAEIVTSVTGAQRRLELGNAIASVQADSVAANMQVRNLPELIAGRAPGVTVFFPNGVAGQAARIRIRGTNSLTVSNDPLVIVDGARVDNSPALGANFSGPGFLVSLPGTGRLSDLNPDEIENIEIVKGPSAATLYGTDAANGVIVVTTKRGQAGRVEWAGNADLGQVQPRGNWTPNYYSWGRNAAGAQVQCTIIAIAANTCTTIDSLTKFNPLTEGFSAPFANGNVQKYGLQVRGGSQQLRYFLSGENNSELGVFRLTSHEQEYVKRLRGVTSIPGEQVRPNYAERLNLRGNVNADLGSNADVAIGAGLVRNDTRIPNVGFLMDGAELGQGKSDTLQQWFSNRRPGHSLAELNDEGVTRVTTSLGARWRARHWLVTRATFGMDYTTSQYNYLVKRGDTPLRLPGRFMQNSSAGALYSADAGATAELDVRPGVSSRTSVGAQLNRNSVSSTIVAASDLAPGASTAAGAATVAGQTAYTATAVAGSYVEEMIGFQDRLFVTGAVRFDGASSFGKNYSTAAYPKAGISWLMLAPSERGVFGQTSVRLRSAYGASGVQPTPLATVSRSQLFTGVVGATGTATSAASPLAVGNPDLKPERQAELEGGADIDVLGGRVRLELTGYNRESSDALINQPLPFSYGLGTGAAIQLNVGRVRNRGVEGLVSFRAIEAERLSWDVQLNGYANQNRLVTLAPGIPVLGSGISRNVPGFPINGLWDRPILGFTDTNGDGVIARSEVTLGDSAVFLGPVAPTRSLSASSTVSLLRNRLSFTALLDRRSGFARWDNNNANRCSIGNCREVNDKTAPKERQAAAVLASSSPTVWTGYVYDGTYTSLRELSATWVLSG